MTMTTSALRRAWAPACTPKGPVYLDAYAALDACFKHHGYRPTAPDCGAYSCRAITGGTGYSLHSYGPGDPYTFWTGLTIATSLAVDINWNDNPYGKRLVTDMPRAMVDDVLRVRTRNGQQVWRWGGDYSTNKDAMHFEIVCDPHDLTTGIDPTTVPGNTSTPEPPKGWLDMLSDEEQEDLYKKVKEIHRETVQSIPPDEKKGVKASGRWLIGDTWNRLERVLDRLPSKG